MSERIIVTGAAGFIGSNIIKGLNERGYTDIIAVDNLTKGDKFKNLVGKSIADYVDKTDFYQAFAAGHYGKVDAIFHEGACSDTMEHNGRYMMDNNFIASRTLLEKCQETGTRLFYASSAATYGGSSQFIEKPEFEKPLNVYGYSKLLFDQVVRRIILPTSKTQVVGFRYFNVYGPGEQHKGRMASVAFHNFNQFQAEGKVKLFGGYQNYGPGQQMRDFVYVGDVVGVNLWFFDHPDQSGVFNLGSGRAQPFNDIAYSVINSLRQIEGQALLSLENMVDAGLIEYTAFPEALIGKYQAFTQADLGLLRSTGCDYVFADVAQGVGRYVKYLKGDL